MGTKQRPKLQDVSIEANDLDALLKMSIKSIKLGRPPKFDDSLQGLEDFKEASISYLEFIRVTNESPANENRLIPDVESWAAYLGTTRMTILEYEKSRGQEWKDFITQMKNIITACKKQLIFRQKIPSIVGIFDLTNNSGYVNSNEFRLNAGEGETRREALTAAELPKLGQAYKGISALPDLGRKDGQE